MIGAEIRKLLNIYIYKYKQMRHGLLHPEASGYDDATRRPDILYVIVSNKWV